jgi:hypothetical protein
MLPSLVCKVARRKGFSLVLENPFWFVNHVPALKTRRMIDIGTNPSVDIDGDFSRCASVASYSDLCLRDDRSFGVSKICLLLHSGTAILLILMG